MTNEEKARLTRDLAETVEETMVYVGNQISIRDMINYIDDGFPELQSVLIDWHRAIHRLEDCKETLKSLHKEFTNV